MAKAVKNGYGTLKFIIFKIYSPINTMKNDIIISIASAFKYPPRDFIISFECTPIFLAHLCGIWCSIVSFIYILSVQIKYVASRVIKVYIPIVGNADIVWVNLLKKSET